MPVECTCERCHVVFAVPPSQTRYTAARFCSPTCYYAWAKETGYFHNRLTKTCEVCGTTFTVVASRKSARFCSQKCMLIWRGPVLRRKSTIPEAHIARTCEWCGKEFSIHRARLSRQRDGVKVRNGDGRFCSRACTGAWISRYAQNKVSKIETVFAEALASQGLVFERHAHIGSFCVDIYFPEHQLVVEFDGEYWHSLPHVVVKDARKDAYCASHGYRIVRVPERLFRDAPEQAIQLVLDALPSTQPDVYQPRLIDVS